MEEETKVVTMTDEDGEEFELEVVKEFEYKNKKYVVLYEEGCSCDDDCEEDCECDDECDCEEDCDCDCHEEDGCDGHIYIFEAVSNEDGKAEYREIDESLMEEILPVVEKELYGTEE